MESDNFDECLESEKSLSDESGNSSMQSEEDIIVDVNKKTLEENIAEPKPGMEFESVDDVFEYYENYGNKIRFQVKKRSSKKTEDDVVYWVAIACSREGKTRSKCKNSFKMRPICKTNCAAKINAILGTDEKWRLTSVILDHNHALCTPGKTRYFKKNRKISSFVKRKLEMNDRAGIRPTHSYNACAVEAGGIENVPFLLKDCYNYVDKARKLRLGDGDAVAVQNYFFKMQENNADFFYSMESDHEDGRIKSLFWADARSRAVCVEFGDVITFDTTYLTNKYDMPFAPFVGVNHHGQSILLGCGLLSNEKIQTFTWLFKAWLVCMKGRAPIGIIADQDMAMKSAVESVFPDTRHRWCLWHIMKKLPEKLSGYNDYKSIKFSIKHAVYDSLSNTEFETSWSKLIEEFDLKKNVWLTGLYEERYRWVPVFVKDSFWAGMSTTQRSESMNAFFDGYVNSKTTLKQFVEQYENALRAKVEKERLADFGSLNASIPCVSKYKVERQFQEVYTTKKFKEFQEEIKGKLYCDYSFVRIDGVVEVYEVTEDMIGDTERQAKFIVTFSVDGNDIKCNCRLFEFRGIVCRHSLLILTNHKKYKAINEKFILKRWRKDVKRCHTKVKIAYSDWEIYPENERCDRLCNMFHEVVDLATESEEKTKFVGDTVQWCYKQLKSGEWNSSDTGIIKSVVNDSVLESNGTNIPTTSTGAPVPRSPLAVRRKGRPPSTRMQGNVEKAIKKKKQKTLKGSKSTLDDVRTTEVLVGLRDESISLDIFQNVSTQSSLPVMQDTGSTSQVEKDPFGAYAANVRPDEYSQQQGCWNGVYDVNDDSNNLQEGNNAAWDLSRQFFDPFWQPDSS